MSSLRANPFPSLPGLTRQSIFFERLLRRGMDARVKPAHDGVWIASSQALLAMTVDIVELFTLFPAITLRDRA
jgi:hypothetical protein